MQSLPNISPYQRFLIAVLAVLLFTVVLDFMLLSALSAILLPQLAITTAQFGWLVSAYAFSAGISAILVSGFADQFDRKKLLLFFYTGFLAGILLCALAQTYTTFFIARIITGVFGGVIGATCFAIITDSFDLSQRGRVMGFVQLAFASSQVVGLPLGLYLATQLDWHLTYGLILLMGCMAAALVFLKMKPVDAHLQVQSSAQAFQHLIAILANREYLAVFINNTLLAAADIMLMTFSSAFSTNNMGISLEHLPLLYGVGGIGTILFAPLIGRLADKYGSLRIFTIGTVLALTLVGIYTNLGLTPLWVVLIIHSLLFIGINARMISSATLATAMPEATDRGAFMAVDASLQQGVGGMAAAAAGLIVFQSADGIIHRFPLLGIIVIVVMLITIGLMFLIHSIIQKNR